MVYALERWHFFLLFLSGGGQVPISDGSFSWLYLRDSIAIFRHRLNEVIRLIATPCMDNNTTFTAQTL